MDRYVTKDGKRLRCGYTTGSCAAGAAKRATELVLGPEEQGLPPVEIGLPSGERVELLPEAAFLREGRGYCCIRKDGGDDPDVTTGTLIWAVVRVQPGGESGAAQAARIIVEGGAGIGRVTKPGLAIPVGEAAINPVPLAMIQKEVADVCRKFDFSGEVNVVIEAPEGAERAKRTFNPNLGITGGISILGTTGIVEPMSEQALIDTIRTEMNVAKAGGATKIVITPGNYGETFFKKQVKTRGEIHQTAVVKCGNFIGEAIDSAIWAGFTNLLIVGHVGKLVKVAAGVMNTHSKYGDGRIETFQKLAIAAGGRKGLAEKLEEAVTTDQAIRILEEEDPQLCKRVLDDIVEACMEQVGRRAQRTFSVGRGEPGGKPEIGITMFSNVYGLLGER